MNSANEISSEGALCASRLERCDDDDTNPRAALTRPGPWDESGRTLNHYATKADVANLKPWMVGLLPVVVLNVVGTVGAIVAVVVIGSVPAPRLPRLEGKEVPGLGQVATCLGWVLGGAATLTLPSPSYGEGKNGVVSTEGTE